MKNMCKVTDPDPDARVMGIAANFIFFFRVRMNRRAAYLLAIVEVHT